MSDTTSSNQRKPHVSHPINRPVYNQTVHKKAKRCKCCDCKCYWLSRQWHKRSKLERGCIIILILCLYVIIGLSITVHVLKHKKFDTNKICLSKECVVSAGLILESLNLDVNPCENFHDFACGGFMDKSLENQKYKDNHILFTSPGVDFFTQQLNIFHARVKGIMDETDNGTQIRSLITAKTLYASCVNTEKIEDLHLQPLTDILKNMGNWPVVVGNNWDESIFQWKDMLSKLSLYGFDASLFFTLTVEKDNVQNANILTMSKPMLKFPVDEETFSVTTWMNDARVVNYYNYMVNASILLGANRTIAEEEMKKVVDFEAKLVDLVFKGHSETPIKLPISSLQQLLPQLNWIEYLSKVLPIKVTGKEFINVESKNSISKILDLVQASSKRTISNFMLWRVVQTSLQYLDKTARNLSQNFEPHFNFAADSQRWFVCLQNVWTSIVTPGAMYVRKYVTKNDKLMVEELVNVLRNELKPVIQKLHGLKTEDRLNSLNLLEEMKHYLFPNEFLRDDQLDQFYSTLSFNEEEYFHNMLRLLKFLRDVKFKELLNPPNKPHWANVYFPFHVKYNLGYIYDNTVEIPFYMLIGFNFNGDKPRYINYASLATYLGKEIIQLLPEEVRQRLFSDRDRCSLIHLGNKNIPIVVSDSMGTMAALKLAYGAYRKWVENNEVEKPLPGLYFTPEQLFWITDATIACGKYEKLSSEQSEVISRINIPASNMEEFSQDFSCPVGASMNPIEKCDLWR